ncbi:MAG: HDIG domain-containing protein [Victivallaceae bacterium]|nr:HDIG domain-containing protein [Victivallaceae bacterium]
MGFAMDWQEIFFSFYSENTPMRRILLRHSMQVREKALSLLNENSRIDAAFVADAVMLHDIGIGRCHAPSIFCDGAAPYIAHGILGAEMVRAYGRAHRVDLEKYARICERHTGCGLSAAEIVAQRLPLPARDFLPETPEELLVCFADKFFSKSGGMQEKSPDAVRRQLEKFGEATLARFDRMRRLFLKE